MFVYMFKIRIYINISQSVYFLLGYRCVFRMSERSDYMSCWWLLLVEILVFDWSRRVTNARRENIYLIYMWLFVTFFSFFLSLIFFSFRLLCKGKLIFYFFYYSKWEKRCVIIKWVVDATFASNAIHEYFVVSKWKKSLFSILECFFCWRNKNGDRMYTSVSNPHISAWWLCISSENNF